MKVILGLNWGHDGAAAIVRDGRLMAAVALERITRKKKDTGITSELLEYVFEAAGVRASDISAIAFAAFIPSPNNPIRLFRKGGDEIVSPVFDLFGGDTFVELEALLDGRRIPAFFINHHIAHCSSAFFTSSFERAACMSVDASMFRPEACSIMAYGDGTHLRYLRCPGIMIGNAYSVFTGKLGLGPGLTKAGTLMGLAPYGKPNAISLERWPEFGASFYARQFQQSDSVFIQYMWSLISGLAPHADMDPSQSDSPKAQEIAASIQFVFERTLLTNARALCEDTQGYSDGNLCLSGGSCLNSEANMLIKRESGFKRLHLFPGCGDDGTAVGSALFVAHTIAQFPRQSYTPGQLAYLGKEYPTPLDLPRSEEALPGRVAELISQGKIVGLFQGRGEFGPRALGNRSLLADPRRAEMKDFLNAQVKRREWFRPFAPSVMAEYRYELFDCEDESPFMLLIAKVKKPEVIPAVSHVDSTARVQTVSQRDNPYFYSVLSEFNALTGVPVLLNTSMNMNGEPLVESPSDALRFLRQGTIDALVINDRLIVVE